MSLPPGVTLRIAFGVVALLTTALLLSAVRQIWAAHEGAPRLALRWAQQDGLLRTSSADAFVASHTDLRASVVQRPLLLTAGAGAAIVMVVLAWGVARGATDQLVAERHESEARYRTLFDANPMATWLLADPGLEVLAVNDAALRLYGYSEEELLGASFDRVREATPGEPRFARHRRKDGAVLEVEEVWRQFHLAGRAVWLVAMNDVTERRCVEERLLKGQRLEAIGQLAGGIAHDFNNLLGVIMGYGQALLRRLPDDERLRRDVGQILRASGRAADLIRQILAFSRQQVLQPTVFDVNEVVGETEGMLRRVIGEEIELTLGLHQDLPPIRADRGQIVQVILNLAVNARDAMPRGGDLRVRTARVEVPEPCERDGVAITPGGYVALTIADTGAGMDAEVRRRIFEPFFTTKGEGRGTGLGLATVYGIVKQSGGYIWVESEPGRGSVFEIHLPAVEAPEEGERTLAARAPSTAPPRGSETVLVLEDDDSLRELVAGTLREHGYSVLAARSGDEALRLQEGHAGPIHLLLADVVVPRMRGPEVARQMRLQRPETGVLYVSAYGGGASGPVAPLLEKPFLPEELLRRIREALDAQGGAVS